MTHPLDGIDRKLALVVVLLCVPLLFLPKINIVSLEGETAGLRFDDFMLLGAALVLLFARLASNRPLIMVEGIFLLFFAATMISAMLGVLFYSSGYDLRYVGCSFL